MSGNTEMTDAQQAITVHNVALTPVEFNGRRVVTLAMINRLRQRPEGTRVSHSTCTKTGCLKVKITSYAIHTKPNCSSLRSFFHFLRIYKKQVQQEARQITRLLASSAVTALSLFCTASLPSTRRAWAHREICCVVSRLLKAASIKS